jgi:hypothetical protein
VVFYEFRAIIEQKIDLKTIGIYPSQIGFFTMLIRLFLIQKSKLFFKVIFSFWPIIIVFSSRISDPFLNLIISPKVLLSSF